MSAVQYRSDIDGLRAVAVLAVVAFHAFPQFLAGGFIGVDIFFVISGYLMFFALRKKELSFISVRDFFVRRVVRIFPALLLVLSVCYLLGWAVLLPEEYVFLAKYIAAGAGFVANFVLLGSGGYFELSSDSNALLHLWSLGVEEQFYLFLPAFLWFVSWRRLHLGLSLASAVLFFFLLGLWLVEMFPLWGFYSPFSRFWELFFGVLLGWLVSSYQKESNFLIGSIFSLLGAFLIVLGFFLLRGDEPFPGVRAILPCLGAALIIGAGEKALINRYILSRSFLVWVGLISYPLYLWHWPALVYMRLLFGGDVGFFWLLVVLVVVVIVSWLTYLYVEQPLRSGSGVRKALYLLGGMVVVFSVGLGTMYAGGFSFRQPELIQQLVSYRYDYAAAYREGRCFLRPEQGAEAFSECEDVGHGPLVYLWGDSHAAHLYPGLELVYGQSSTITQRTASGCPPVLGLKVADRPHCQSINQAVMKDVSERRPETVLLSARWGEYDLDGLSATVSDLRAAGVRNLIVVGPAPLWQESLPRQLYLYYRRNLGLALPSQMSFGLDASFEGVDAQMRSFSEKSGVRYISVRDLLCAAGECRTLTDEGQLMVWDYGHLTREGSLYLMSRIDLQVH